MNTAFKEIFPGAISAHVLLRITVALLLAAHGVFRVYNHGVEDFGIFLQYQGLPWGLPIVYIVTGFEIIGGLLLLLNFLTRPVSLGFILMLIGGIILIHAKAGWFVVGVQTGGMEYSVLLIICLVVIAAGHKK